VFVQNFVSPSFLLAIIIPTTLFQSAALSFNMERREDVDGFLNAIMVVCVFVTYVWVRCERAVSGTSAALIWSRVFGVVLPPGSFIFCSSCAPGVQFFLASTFPASRTAATNSSSEPSSHLPSLPQPSRSSTSSRLP